MVSMPWAELKQRADAGVSGQTRAVVMDEYIPGMDGDALAPFNVQRCERCARCECDGCGNDNPILRSDGGSADCYYVGPEDHERLERQGREAKDKVTPKQASEPAPRRGEYDAIDGFDTFDADWRTWHERETGESLEGLKLTGGQRSH